MKHVFMLEALLVLTACGLAAQDAATQATAKPTEHLIGTIAAVDAAAHSITVKDDKSGAPTVILLAETRTFIKVAPGAKDLKSAMRITADQLAVGDRVDVRGNRPPDDPAKVAARSVVLMSGRDLQQAHAVQAAAWQSAPAGVVTSVDPATNKITINERTAEGRKPVVLQASATTEFTRYSPANPAVPATSQLTQIQPGDQVRVIGDPSADGATIAASRVYSEALRTLSGTVLSIAPDGKGLTVRDLASKKPVELTLNDSSAIQKLSPEMAAVMARRMNGGGGRPAAGGATSGQNNSSALPATGAAPPNGANQGGSPPGRMRGSRNGDISRLLDRLPTITLADLKPGDAVVVSGISTGASDAPQQLIATHVIAGVEPLLQSTPARRGGNQSLGGDWGLGEMTIPQ